MAVLEREAVKAASLASHATGTTADWISAICSLIAVVLTLLTLIAVYLASDRLGLPRQSLGPWKSIAGLPSALPMQPRIMTPTLNVALLVKNDWQPKFSSPVALDSGSNGPNADLEASKMALVQASWVTFFEDFGMSPESGKGFYKMRYESESVNGIVPVRWEGRHLAAICSTLGFHSIESKPNSRKLMELPTQWSGPLGWLQFRPGSGGCIVEYRRISMTKDQLPLEFHHYYRLLGVESRPFKFKSRLWQSIAGMSLSDNEVIFLSDTWQCTERMSDCGGNTGRPVDAVCEESLEREEELIDEGIRWETLGGKVNGLQGLPPGGFENDMPQVSPGHKLGMPNPLRDPGSDTKAMEGNSKKMVVLRPSPGHQSIAIGELIHSRGLGRDHAREYSYIYTDGGGVCEVYKHKLGCLHMDMESLGLMKKAVIQIEPDGFYFSPSRILNFQVAQIWSHASSLSEKRLCQQCIFPVTPLGFWAKERGLSLTSKDSPEKQLYNAINLVNHFQSIKSTSRTMFTMADLAVISKASVSLRGLIGRNGMDLVWAILASPELFGRLEDHITRAKMQDLLDSRLTCESGRLSFTQMNCSDQEVRLPPGEIEVELVADGTFEGTQIVAAFVDVFLNFFWIDRGWVTDIAHYDITMPQSVTMC